MIWSLIKKEKKRILEFLYKISLIVILVVVFYIGLNDKFRNISWEGVGVILAFCSLIFSMILNHRQKRVEILLEKSIRDQEKFEGAVEEISNFYPQLIEDYIRYTNFPLREPVIEPYHFDIDALDTVNALNAKYTCLLITIENKVDYLYKYHNKKHPKYDKFREKVCGMNTIINKNIFEISNLVNDCFNGGVGFTSDEARSIVEKRTVYVGNITKLYQDNINELYVLANNAVEERNRLSIK